MPTVRKHSVHIRLDSVRIQDLVDFAKAVEEAVEVGYRRAMSEDLKADQKSSLVS